MERRRAEAAEGEGQGEHSALEEPDDVLLAAAENVAASLAASLLDAVLDEVAGARV